MQIFLCAASLMLVCGVAYFDALKLDSPKIAKVDSAILVAHVTQPMQHVNLIEEEAARSMWHSKHYTLRLSSVFARLCHRYLTFFHETLSAKNKL